MVPKPEITPSRTGSVSVVRLRHRWRMGDWRGDLTRDLSEVVDLVDGAGVPVYLVGGLGLAVRSDDFYRNHADLDLAVFLPELPQLLQRLADAGYRLCAATAGFPISPWHRVDRFRPVTVGEVMSDPDAGCLRLVRSNAETGVFFTSRRTDVIDLLLLSHRSDRIMLHGYDCDVPRTDFFPDHPMASSSYLRLPNLRYKAHLPSSWPRQRQDLAAAGLEA